jgi:hypothetical protein
MSKIKIKKKKKKGDGSEKEGGGGDFLLTCVFQLSSREHLISRVIHSSLRVL